MSPAHRAKTRKIYFHHLLMEKIYLILENKTDIVNIQSFEVYKAISDSQKMQNNNCIELSIVLKLPNFHY